jgi:hypothetical protein
MWFLMLRRQVNAKQARRLLIAYQEPNPSPFTILQSASSSSDRRQLSAPPTTDPRPCKALGSTRRGASSRSPMPMVDRIRLRSQSRERSQTPAPTQTALEIRVLSTIQEGSRESLYESTVGASTSQISSVTAPAPRVSLAPIPSSSFLPIPNLQSSTRSSGFGIPPNLGDPTSMPVSPPGGYRIPSFAPSGHLPDIAHIVSQTSGPRRALPIPPLPAYVTTYDSARPESSADGWPAAQATQPFEQQSFGLNGSAYPPRQTSYSFSVHPGQSTHGSSYDPHCVSSSGATRHLPLILSEGASRTQNVYPSHRSASIPPTGLSHGSIPPPSAHRPIGRSASGRSMSVPPVGGSSMFDLHALNHDPSSFSGFARGAMNPDPSQGQSHASAVALNHPSSGVQRPSGRRLKAQYGNFKPPSSTRPRDPDRQIMMVRSSSQHGVQLINIVRVEHCSAHYTAIVENQER